MIAIEFSVKTRGLYNKPLLVEKSAASAFVAASHMIRYYCHSK